MLWNVVRWEVMRHLRDKQFIIGLLITPVIFVVFGAAPTVIERLDRPRDATFLVVDELQAVPWLQTTLADSHVTVQSTDAPLSILDNAVLEGDADGYFVLDREFVETGAVQVFMDKPRPVPDELTGALNGLLQTMRMQDQGLDPQVLQYVSARATVAASVVNGPDDHEQQLLSGLVMSGVLAFLLLFLIIGSGAMLMQSAVQEKRDRMSEIVLSSISADTLMLGKIVGHFVLGIIQIGFWLLIGLPVLQFGLNVPVGDFVSPSLLPPLLLFVLLGYLFYAAVFVGVGATMSDIQSASNTQGLVTMLPMLSLLFMPSVTSAPDGFIAKVATFFPLTTPIIAMVRIGMETMAGWEMAVAGVLMLAATWLVAKAASRLFRTGMLMYGKNATWKEVWRWIRYPG